MKKLNDNLSEIFDIEPMEQPEVLPAVKPTTEVIASDEVETDAALARKNIKGLLDKGGAAIDNLLLVAQESEHPRAYEVAANFIKDKKYLVNDQEAIRAFKQNFSMKKININPKNVNFNENSIPSFLEDASEYLGLSFSSSLSLSPSNTNL